MAVFMLNTCNFSDCGATFPTLKDLIYHIEYAHIDHDPIANQQREASQPASIPLSYAVRFTSDAGIRKYRETMAAAEMQRQMTASEPSSVGTHTPTGSEYEDDDGISQSEDSNDSWTTVEEYSSEFILRYGSSANGAGAMGGLAVDKPFACPVPGCKKRYKNINGIKYHSKNGHKKDGKVRKDYKCHCGKSYKTAQGLKNHSIMQHFVTESSAVNVPRPGTSQMARAPRPLSWLMQVYEAAGAGEAAAEPPSKRRRVETVQHVQRRHHQYATV